MPQFDISYFAGQIFWLILVFGILYLVVHYFIVPKAESVLNYRANSIANNIQFAEFAEQEMRNLSLEKDEDLAKMRKAADEIYDKSLAAVDLHLRKKEEELEQLAAIYRDKVAMQMKDETSKLKAMAQEKKLSLAAAIIAKITGKPADGKMLQKIEIGMR